MNKNKSSLHSISRREFLTGMAAITAGIAARNAFAKPSPTTISVDLHSHAYLGWDDMNAFKLNVGPDVTFISGHPYLGELPEVFEAIEKWKTPIAKTPKDILAAKAQGKRVALIANEGGYILNGNLDTLEHLHAKGLISLQLVRKDHYEELVDDDGDLTSFGKEVIRAQNRLGMIVDLSHCKEDTIRQAVDVSSKPVMLSHVNKPVEDAWSAVAESGGVIGNWWHPRDVEDGLTFEQWIDGFARMADAVGVDHIGVQTEIGTTVHRGGPFDSYKKWNNIEQALLAKGFNQEEKDKIMGGNFMRMFASIAGDGAGVSAAATTATAAMAIPTVPSQPTGTLNADQVKQLFSNKTFDGYSVFNDKNYQVYCAADGNMELIRPNGDSVQRYWRVDEQGRYCVSNWKDGDGKCSVIVSEKPGEYKRITDGEHNHTLTNFVMGNQL